MMLAAKARGWTIHCMEQKDLFLNQGRAFAKRRRVNVFDDNEHWFDAEEPIDAPLAENNIILMRKDPPFDMDFVYTTHILDRCAMLTKNYTRLGLVNSVPPPWLRPVQTG